MGCFQAAKSYIVGFLCFLNCLPLDAMESDKKPHPGSMLEGFLIKCEIRPVKSFLIYSKIAFIDRKKGIAIVHISFI